MVFETDRSKEIKIAYIGGGSKRLGMGPYE